MKPILVPTDFSKCANNAMTYALEIAARTGQPVTVLYVVYPNEGLDNNLYDTFFIDHYVQERLDGMNVWVKKFTRRPAFKSINIQVECRIGFPVSTIAETAKILDASLIVMGTTGASGLSGVLLGSIAGGVISAARTPVFVVPLKAVFRDTARFAFATDFRLGVSEDSLQTMREMLQIQHTGLDIVHIITEQNKPLDQTQEQVLSKKLGDIPHQYHYLHDKNVVRAIHDFIEANDCNGLLVIAHEHALLHKLFARSVSRALAHRTKVPILVLHDK